MEATITKRSATSFTVEVEIPYEFTSMLNAETTIQAQVNKAGTLATGEALKQFDTDGSPIVVAGTKLTSKGQIHTTYQTPYGDVMIDRHIYQSAHGGRGYCPLEYRARIVTTATPKCAKMVASKYANTSAGQAQVDLEENHGRSMSRLPIQDICDVVGSIAAVKEDNGTFLKQHAEAQLIDFYHASEYIGKVGRAAVPQKRRDQWIPDTCHALKHDVGAAGTIWTGEKGSF